MGNAESSGGTANVLSGLKRAQNDKNSKLYRLVDYQGSGELVSWVKLGLTSGDFNIFDSVLEVAVAPFMYGGGKCKLVPISDLVKIRNRERNAMLGALRRKKGKGKSGPNIFEGVNQAEMQGDMMKALKMLDGGGKNAKGGAKYKELCWDLDQRGGMGETLLHICLLHGTTLHNEIAERLVIAFPKLVNDIYLSEDYYGQTALHQAIVNEDAGMVKFLLKHNADIHARCYGSFFCPDDQRASRTDSLEHEAVDVSPTTNYMGQTYWGEYPLSFAACTRQMECFRLLRANKADPNMRDTNGNTVLHFMVIHEFPDVFDLAHRLGAKLHIANNLKLTPLTLAAKIGSKKMFDHVLTIERDLLWTYGGVTCAAYPLNYIDTIEEKTGEMNSLSALSLIVYEESNQHLDLLDGLIEELLLAKWKAFAKTKLLQQLLIFIIFYACLFFAFLYRPITSNYYYDGLVALGGADQSSSIQHTDYIAQWHASPFSNFSMDELNHAEKCHLLKVEDIWSIIRLSLEAIVLLGTLAYLVHIGFQARRLTWRAYLKSLKAFPAKCAFHISLMLILAMLPLRFICVPGIENALAVLALLCASMHFLFFLRASKFVGPFVLMFYKMIAGDVLQFSVIYAIFLLGYSQSFFLIFNGCQRGKSNETEFQFASKLQDAERLAHPIEAALRMFIMSIGEFTLVFQVVKACRLSFLGKVLFLLYELTVSIMLVNMLIASMARTYDAISLTQKEWKRQWAKVILMLEQTCPPKERLIALLKYSRPIGTDKTKRAFVVRRRLTVILLLIGISHTKGIEAKSLHSLNLSQKGKDDEKKGEAKEKRHIRKQYNTVKRMYKERLVEQILASAEQT